MKKIQLLNRNIIVNNKCVLVNIAIVGCIIISNNTFAQMLINPQATIQQLNNSATAITASNNKYLVTFKPGTSRKQRADIAHAAGAHVRFNYNITHSIAIKVNNLNALNALRNRPEVIDIIADRILTIDAPRAPLIAPTNLMDTGITSNSVGLTWDDTTSDEDGFSIERCTGSSCTSFTEIGTTSADTNTYTDTTVSSANTYRFQVRAFRLGGAPSSRFSSFSNILDLTTAPATPPAAATLLSIIGTTHNTVDLNWMDNSADESGFRLERCLGVGCSTFSTVSTTGANVTAFTDTTVISSSTYNYRVFAFNSGGDASSSNVAEATTIAAPPLAPAHSRQIIPLGNQRVGTSIWDGAGVGIAIMDSGLDLDHPDLNVAPEFFDAFAGLGEDDNGHGTHVGGIAAAIDNNIGIKGVASGATLYSVKVANSLGQSEDSELLAGLDWINTNAALVDPPISVVNMSLGRDLEISDVGGPLQLAIQTLYNNGIVVVTSAGNDSTAEVFTRFPASFPEVIAVGGTIAETGSPVQGCIDAGLANTLADSAAYFTTDGAFDPATNSGITVSAVSEGRIDHYVSLLGCEALLHGTLSTRLILAPEDPLDPNTILTSRNFPCPADPNCPALAVGTSFASPRVAGVAALIIQSSGTIPSSGFDIEVIRTQIRNSADRRDSAVASPVGFDYAPLDQPYAGSGYSFDGEREGLVQAP